MKNWNVIKTIMLYATVKHIANTFYVFVNNDIDKNGIIYMLENSGFKITDLGYGRFGYFNENHKLEIVISD